MKMILFPILIICYVVVTDCAELNFLKNHPNWQLLNSPRCGIVNTDNVRLLNGKITRIEKFPWSVQITERIRIGNKKGDKFLCNGAIINNHYIMTAAHCVHRRNIKYVKIGNSVNEEFNDCSDYVNGCSYNRLRILDVIIHKDFNSETFENDIALLRTDIRMTFTNSIQSICIPTTDMIEYNYLGEKFQIASWGQKSLIDNHASNVLEYITLPIRDLCACQQLYPNVTFNPTKLCIGESDVEGGTCMGDSGSVAIWKKHEGYIVRHFAIGITSIGSFSCNKLPAVYTNVNQYLSFILSNIYDEERPAPSTPSFEESEITTISYNTYTENEEVQETTEEIEDYTEEIEDYIEENEDDNDENNFYN